MQSLCLILGCICLIIAFATASFGQVSVFLFSVVLGVIFITYFITSFYKKKTKCGKQKKLYKMEGICLHGLPYGEAKCILEVYDNYINFIVGKNNADLDINKISSILIKDKNELIGASTGNIILGAAVFGAIGGLIAARPKNRKEYVLIINYDNMGTTKEIAIIFDKLYRSYLNDFESFINKRINKNKNLKHITL